VPAGGQFSTKTTSEASINLAEPTTAGRRTVPEIALSDVDKNTRVEAMRSEIDRGLDERADPEGWACHVEAVSGSTAKASHPHEKIQLWA
jgi:hypothetical protein